MLSQFKKILVVSLDNLGDCVMASSFLRPLRHYFPDGQIGIWVKDYAKDIFSQTNYLDKIHSADPFWDKSPGFSKGSFGPFFRSWKDVYDEKYDLAFILNADWRRSLFCQLGRVSHRVGLDQKKSRFFLTNSFVREPIRQHVVDSYQQLFSSFLGLKPTSDFSPVLSLSVDEKKWAQQWRQTNCLNKNIVVMHPFSGDRLKNWHLLNWLKLIRLVNENCPHSYIVVICNQSELSLLQQQIPRDCPVELRGGESLSKIKALLSEASVFIGGDSGPGHMAAALGVHVVSLFNQHKSDVYAPKGTGKVKILFDEKFENLDPPKVLAEIVEILGGK